MITLLLDLFTVMAVDNIADILAKFGDFESIFVGFCLTGNKSSFEPQTEELLIAVRFSRSSGRRVVWTPLMLLAAVTTMGIQPNLWQRWFRQHVDY